MVKDQHTHVAKEVCVIVASDQKYQSSIANTKLKPQPLNNQQRPYKRQRTKQVSQKEQLQNKQNNDKDNTVRTGRSEESSIYNTAKAENEEK